MPDSDPVAVVTVNEVEYLLFAGRVNVRLEVFGLIIVLLTPSPWRQTLHILSISS